MGVLGVFLKVLTKILEVVTVTAPLAELAGRIFKPGQKSGAEKLALMRQAIKQALLSSEFLVGKEIVDEDLLDSAIADFASGAAKIEKATRPRA